MIPRPGRGENDFMKGTLFRVPSTVGARGGMGTVRIVVGYRGALREVSSRGVGDRGLASPPSPTRREPYTIVDEGARQEDRGIAVRIVDAGTSGAVSRVRTPAHGMFWPRAFELAGSSGVEPPPPSHEFQRLRTELRG